MIETPTIVPLLLTGILIGSILRKTTVKIRPKFAAAGSLIGGLGNAAYAGALYFFQGAGETLISFALIAFITGTLMVLVVFASATVTLRLRGRTEGAT